MVSLSDTNVNIAAKSESIGVPTGRADASTPFFTGADRHANARRRAAGHGRSLATVDLVGVMAAGRKGAVDFGFGKRVALVHLPHGEPQVAQLLHDLVAKGFWKLILN
jgi:hypothetical protein